MYRKTNETEITIGLEMTCEKDTALNLNSGVPFFNHMLHAMLFFTKLSADIECIGDLDVGTHHSLEDIGILMGEAIKGIYSEMRGFNRYACALMPMDDALVRVVLDISGRPYFVLEGLDQNSLSELQQSLIEFLHACCVNARMTVHIDVIRGFNRHHIFEALFKAFGKALGEALTEKQSIMSTKGVIG
ncbi:MAG TPA: imidazoleglycerol-phosphate dehydratase [Clostridiales bacterium UBA8960]|nr:imidazoleglycerol-phosphate dehydratase [Clostridiales bacterium UBA8960]